MMILAVKEPKTLETYPNAARSQVMRLNASSGRILTHGGRLADRGTSDRVFSAHPQVSRKPLKHEDHLGLTDSGHHCVKATATAQRLPGKSSGRCLRCTLH